MIAGLQQWWIALSARERRLIAVAGTLTALVVLWLGILRPLAAAQARADARLDASVARHAAIAARVDVLAAARARAPVRDRVANLAALVAQGAAERGIVLERADPQGDREIAIAMASVRPAALLTWLADLERQGIAASRLTLGVANAGTASASVTLTRVE